MHIYSIKRIESLKKERKIGYSIQELVKKFSMPKTTIWHHIHRIKLSKKARKRIDMRRGGSKIRIQKQWQKAKEEAHEIVNLIDVQEIAPVILSALYWAEGNKRGFVFTNTDEKMIKIFLKILRESFFINNKERVIATLRINNITHAKDSIRYWRRITGLPAKNIYLDINSKQNRGRSKYGICRITLRKGGYVLKLVNCINSELTSKILSSILNKDKKPS